jgi:hypothetical protein
MLSGRTLDDCHERMAACCRVRTLVLDRLNERRSRRRWGRRKFRHRQTVVGQLLWSSRVKDADEWADCKSERLCRNVVTLCALERELFPLAYPLFNRKGQRAENLEAGLHRDFKHEWAALMQLTTIFRDGERGREGEKRERGEERAAHCGQLVRHKSKAGFGQARHGGQRNSGLSSRVKGRVVAGIWTGANSRRRLLETTGQRRLAGRR